MRTIATTDAPPERVPVRPAAGARRLVRVLLVDHETEIVGGGQIGLVELAARLDRTRYEPYLVCAGDGALRTRALDAGVPALVRPMPSLRRGGWRRAPGAAARLRALALRLGIDLVHANGTRAMIYAAAAARSPAIPVVWHVRVLDETGGDRLLDGWLGRLADRVVVNSSAVARRFEGLAAAGRPPVVVWNGIDVAAFRIDGDPTFRRALVGDAAFVLAMVAQWAPWKRIELALQILARLRARGVDAALVLAGAPVPESAAYERRLRALARSLGLGERCVLAGFRDDVPRLLAAADVAIHTARNEPFGRALVEAMAAARPVVAAAGGGADEVVVDGVTGRLVATTDPDRWADELERLWREPELRRARGMAGRRRAEDLFSLDAHVRRIEAVYEDVLGVGR